MLKGLIKNITPPFVLAGARKIIPALAASEFNNCSGVYASYEEAHIACDAQSYENDRIIKAVYGKTLAYKNLLEYQRPLISTPPIDRISAVLGLALGLTPGKQELKVIDFGGACGTHYFITKALLGDSIKLRWCVVETPAMCKQASVLANHELGFYEDIEQVTRELGEPDLAYSDGVFQTVPNPKHYLQRFINCGARFLCIRRIGLIRGQKDLITILKVPLSNHAPTTPLPDGVEDGPTLLPLTALTIDTVEAMLEEHYRIRVRFDDPKRSYRGDNFRIDMHGLFCERTKDTNAA